MSTGWALFLFVTAVLAVAWVLTEVSIHVQHAIQDRRREDIIVGSDTPIYTLLAHEHPDARVLLHRARLERDVARIESVLGSET